MWSGSKAYAVASPDLRQAENHMRVLSDAFIPELPNHYKGKVRENYDLPEVN